MHGAAGTPNSGHCTSVKQGIFTTWYEPKSLPLSDEVEVAIVEASRRSLLRSDRNVVVQTHFGRL